MPSFRHIVWPQKPVPETCPLCGGSMQDRYPPEKPLGLSTWHCATCRERRVRELTSEQKPRKRKGLDY